MQQSNSGLTITASNPLAAALTLQIEVGLPLANVWNPAAGYSTVTLNLAGGSLGGSSVTQFFAYPLTWNTAAGSGGGWQAGSGTWSNSPGLMPWSTSPSGANALSWTDSASANFSANGPSSITVQGTLNVNNMTISGSGYSFSGGTLNVLGGIQSIVSTNIASVLTLAASQTWLCSTSGQTLTVTGNVANNGKLLTLGGSGNVVLGGIISGSGGLVKSGGNYSTLTLSGSNTFTGNVNVNNGALEITNGSALGTGPKTVTADLGTNGNCQIVLNGSGPSGSGNINLPANITFVTSNQSTDGTVFNDGGNNTIAGSFSLASGGGATWFGSNSGSLTLSGNLMPSTTGRFLYLSGPANGVISGRVLNGSGNNVLGLQVMGPGTWTLTGSNTYSAGTKVEGGTLDITADAALGAGTSAVTFSANGTLQAGGTVTLNPTRGIVIGSGATATLDTQAGEMIVKGPISGAGGALMKEGSGLLVLSGSNSYTGGTVIEAGTLQVTAAAVLPAGTNLIVGADATSLFGGTVSGSPSEGGAALAGPASYGAPAEPVPEPGTCMLFIAALCAAGTRKTSLRPNFLVLLPQFLVLFVGSVTVLI